MSVQTASIIIAIIIIIRRVQIVYLYCTYYNNIIIIAKRDSDDSSTAFTRHKRGSTHIILLYTIYMRIYMFDITHILCLLADLVPRRANKGQRCFSITRSHSRLN